MATILAINAANRHASRLATAIMISPAELSMKANNKISSETQSRYKPEVDHNSSKATSAISNASSATRALPVNNLLQQ